MKKFVFKLFIYILIVISIIIGINYVYIDKLSYDGSEQSKFKFVHDNIEISNLGSSHGVHGFDYEDLDDKYNCFNFALNSQTLSYDARVLEAYQDYLADGGILIIDISYFSFWGVPEDEWDDFDSKNKRYYYFLPQKYIKQYDFFTDLFVGIFPSLEGKPLKVFKTLASNIDEDCNIYSYPIVYDVVDTSLLSEDTDSSVYRHILEGKRNEDGSLIVNGEELEAVSKIVSICRSHNVTPIMVTVPYLKEYTDKIKSTDKKFYESFEREIDLLTKTLEIDYYDYSRDERFMYDYSLFYNGDHMNTIGARKFTNILYDEVINDILEKEKTDGKGFSY